MSTSDNGKMSGALRKQLSPRAEWHRKRFLYYPKQETSPLTGLVVGEEVVVAMVSVDCQQYRCDCPHTRRRTVPDIACTADSRSLCVWATEWVYVMAAGATWENWSRWNCPTWIDWYSHAGVP